MIERGGMLTVAMVCAVPVGVLVAVGTNGVTVRPDSSATDDAAVVEVVHVIDGDTIIVDREGREERVRLLGIDAPEVGREGEPQEVCADEATVLVEDLIGGADVVTITDPSQPQGDRFGRTLAYVEADGQDVSGELLRTSMSQSQGSHGLTSM